MEPFKDFFDYEWWLQGSEYTGKGLQYGKWMVIETFWDAGVPRQKFSITNVNPITGTDSARMEIDGSKLDVGSMAWQGLGDSPDTDRISSLNPAYLNFKFRIDEWVTSDFTWRVTLGAIGGAGPGGSALEGQVIIGLEGLAPPRLRLHYRVGSSFDDWTIANTRQVLTETKVSLNVVHTLEIMRIADAVNGVVAVWLDGTEVFRIAGLDTSYPGGMRSVMLGSSSGEENGFFSVGQSEGSRCVITFDDLRVRDSYIGPNPLPPPLRRLTLDSSIRGKTVRVGNHVLPLLTPITIEVPEGTIPKVGIDPTDFDHWEIDPEVSGYPFSSYEELWPDLSPLLMATVNRAPPPPGQNIGPRPTPPIYQDSVITAVYAGAVQQRIYVKSSPVSVPVFIDDVEVGNSPFDGTVYEGNRRIGALDEW